MNYIKVVVMVKKKDGVTDDQAVQAVADAIDDQIAKGAPVTYASTYLLEDKQTG